MPTLCQACASCSTCRKSHCTGGKKSQDIWKTIWIYYDMTYCFPNLLINLQFGAFEAISCLECHGTGTALGDPIEAARPAVPPRCCPFPSPSCQRGRSELRKQSTARAKAPSRWRPERRTWGTWKAGKDGIRGTRRCHETSWKATWNSMKHLESCWVGKWTMSILPTNTAKSLWLFAPGAAGVAGLSKAAWSSSCSSPSPDPTQCCQIGCDCHRSCRVNEHKCQHCYGSASAALKIWIKQKTELAHWQIKQYWIRVWISLCEPWTWIFTIHTYSPIHLELHDFFVFEAEPQHWFDWIFCFHSHRALWLAEECKKSGCVLFRLQWNQRTCHGLNPFQLSHGSQWTFFSLSSCQ